MICKSCRVSTFFLLLSFMLATASPGEGKPEHGGLHFWTVGGGPDGLAKRFGMNVYEILDELNTNKDELDRFLLAIAECPLTEKQLVEESEVAPSRVEYFISKLHVGGLIRKDENGRWATTVPVITDKEMEVIRKDVTPMASSVARYMKKEALQLKALYDLEKSHLDPSWEDITHLLIDKFIIDGTFHGGIIRLQRERGSQPSEEQNPHTTPAFFLEQGKNFSSFGTNWYPFNQGDDQREVYVLHGAVLDRYDIAMNRYRGDQEFSSVLFKITPEGSIHALNAQEKGMLRHLEWIAEERLLVPIVHANTIESLWPMIEKMGSDAAKVAFEHFSDLTDSFSNSPYSDFSDGSDDYIQVCYHVLFGVLIEQLVVNGAVSPIPEPVPEHFGVYFVLGKLF